MLSEEEYKRILQKCNRNLLKYDKMHLKLILEAIFTLTELKKGNLPDYESHGQTHNAESLILERNRLEYSKKLFIDRLTTLAEHFEIAIERYSERQFRVLVEEILNCYRRRYKIVTGYQAKDFRIVGIDEKE